MEKNLFHFSATLPSPHSEKRFLFDVRFLKNQTKKPIIIFIHGFKGFKDWGHFNLLADYFAENGFVFCKLNLSHNGTSPEHPTTFSDLEAFGNNNFSKELDDIATMIDYFHSPQSGVPDEEMDTNALFLLGHSRGGGIALLKANEDNRVKAVVTLAAISDLQKGWTKEKLAKWKEEGVLHVYNGRTNQNMPLYYQIVEDFNAHKDRLDIPRAVKNLNKPALIIHGTQDETLPTTMAHDIKSWGPQAELLILEGANHTFGGYHPYPLKTLPLESLKAAEAVNHFLKRLTPIS